MATRQQIFIARHKDALEADLEEKGWPTHVHKRDYLDDGGMFSEYAYSNIRAQALTVCMRELGYKKDTQRYYVRVSA
jgi:hypothetical protein